METWTTYIARKALNLGASSAVPSRGSVRVCFQTLDPYWAEIGFVSVLISASKLVITDMRTDRTPAAQDWERKLARSLTLLDDLRAQAPWPQVA